MKKRYLPLLALLSFSALAEVSFEEKKNRIEYLEELSQEAVSMNIDAYRRELQYEKQNLPLEKRAENEAFLLVEKIKIQIHKAYEAALEGSSPDEASEEVRNAIEKDLELIDPALRGEVRNISLMTLENAERGIMTADTDVSVIARIMLKGVQERHDFFNEEGEMFSEVAGMNYDASKTTYSSKKQILQSLVSDRDSVKGVSNANMTVKADAISRREGKIGVQVKAEFLGVSVDAGPTILFTRLYRTGVVVNAEGLNPIMNSNGSFDFSKLGSKQRRLIVFNCEAELSFESDYSGSGGFSIAGVGGSATLAKKYSNKVTLTSRKLAIPDSIDGKSVTLKSLNQLCHMDFLKTKVTNTMNVAGSLNIMMKNVIAGLRFSHPQTKCVTDNHCLKWFNKEVVGLMKLKNTPKCVENTKEKSRSCELRGLKGQNCAVYNNKGKRVSDGLFEFKCNTGLTCVKVQDEGWLKGGELYQYAKGRCMPAARR